MSVTEPVASRRALIELGVVAAVYVAYSFVRNRFGSASVSPDVAYANAVRIIEWERGLRAFVELDVQRAFVGNTTFIQFWNLHYGVFHFVCTVLAFGWALLRLSSETYRWWRNAIVSMTLIALAGYAAFPLMPPRLLADCGDFGACAHELVFVDTVSEIGGIWSFETEAVRAVTNQYAAMPSLHIGWALWVAFLIWRRFPNGWVKALAVAHPVATLFGITVTGNHWWLDAVGGAAAFGLGIAIAALVRRASTHRKSRWPRVHGGQDTTIVKGDGPRSAVFS